MYWAWRPVFVAQMRKILGEDAVILANSAGAVSDPSLSGITIEMESCVGRLPTDVTDICVPLSFAQRALNTALCLCRWLTSDPALL